jgi:uncharacterized repeat protein (TIGR03837 family)
MAYPQSAGTLLPHTFSADIFCRVIDNFGDAGVCWRLAQRLALGFGWHVRLFIDRPEVLHALVPVVQPTQPAQTVQQVEVLAWHLSEQSSCAEVVIEAFACDPPAVYLERMRQQDRAPVWINLEYLSAEPWVSGCHRLPSPQPGGLTKYFFFPGFWDYTGGVVHTPQEQAAISRAAALPVQTLGSFGVHLQPGAKAILLFCYEAACIDEMLADARSTQAPLHFVLPEGPVAQRLLGQQRILQQDNMTLQRLEFCQQPEFDRLLAACDLNFVRGEDSLVRAMLTGKPFVWNIYAQQDYAHLAKLQAFMQWWEAGAHASLQSTVRVAHGAWNNHHWPAGTFGNMLDVLQRWNMHAQQVATRIWLEEDLGSQLATFVRDQLKSMNTHAGSLAQEQVSTQPAVQ